MLGGSGGHLPIFAGVDLAGADILGADFGRLSRQRPAPVNVNALAERVAYAGLPIVGEQSFVRVQDSLCYLFREGRSEHLKGILLARALVPATKQEAGVVDVVIEVMVREKELVDICRPEAGQGEYPSGVRTDPH